MPAFIVVTFTCANLLLIAGLVAAPPLAAQSNGPGAPATGAVETTRITPAQQGTRGVVIGTVAELPGAPEGVAVILRDPDVGDILLLRENATVSQLAAALTVLLQSRVTDGDTVTELQRLVVRGEGVPPHWKGLVENGLSADIARLRSAQQRALRHVGSVPAIFVSLAELNP